MSARPGFHIARWLTGGLFALLAVNFLLIAFVSGMDIFLGQPPQLMVPAFALLVASSALVVARSSTARATEASASEVSERKPRRNRARTEPAYAAMTIIGRPYVEAAQTLEHNEWKGAIQ